MPIITILEVLIIIIFRNVLIGEKYFKYTGIFLPISILTMWLNEKYLSNLNNIGIIIIMSMISFVIFKISNDDLITVIIEVVAATTIMLLGELLGLTVATTFKLTNQWIVLGFAIVIWVLLGIGLQKSNIGEKFGNIFKIENSKVVINILINSILVFLLFKSLNDKGILNSDIAIEMALYITLFIALSFNLFITISNELKEKNRLQMENDFKPVFNEYIQTLRANEHEYKNHLNAIYSIINVSDEGDIKDNINKYIGNIKDNNYLNNLLYIDNTTLKAILYSKMAVAEEKGIKMTYDISSNLKDINLDQMDLVVVLSNLLNNAIEAVDGIDEPWVYINISELELIKNKRYNIAVSNSIGTNKQDIINAINKGVTTKGGNRGFGLYNVKKILKKSGGELLIGIEDDFIKIEVSI